MMREPKCTPYPPATRYRRKAVRALRFDGDTLTIEIQGEAFAFAHVVFRSPTAFRVLDERDLCEFWPDYSEPNGWLYEVEQGGWMELEAHRQLFNSPTIVHSLKEWLIVDEMCISVLSVQPPEIIDLGSDPEQVGATD
jgi:hypothetical protein